MVAWVLENQVLVKHWTLLRSWLLLDTHNLSPPTQKPQITFLCVSTRQAMSPSSNNTFKVFIAGCALVHMCNAHVNKLLLIFLLFICLCQSSRVPTGDPKMSKGKCIFSLPYFLPTCHPKILFIYFWLHWVFLLCVAFSSFCKGVTLQLQWEDFSLPQLLLFLECRLWAHGLRQLWCACLVAPRHVESSRTRDQTRVLCIGRQIFIH